MLKDKKYSIIVTAIIFLVTLILCVAVFLPRNIGNLLNVVGKPVEKYDASQISAEYGCYSDRNGKLTINNNDPQIIFSCEGQEIETIKIDVKAPQNETVTFEVFTAFEEGVFTSERCYADTIFEGKESVVIDLPQGEYHFIRIDFNVSGIYFESLELYSENPEQVPFKPDFTLLDYLKGIGIPIVVAVLVWFIDAKTKFAQKAIENIKKNKFQIITFVIFSIVAILIGVLIELLIGLISQTDFSKYRAVFLCGAVELITIFVYMRKSLAKKPENLFLPIAIVLGAVMLFGSPVKHIAWDVDSHHPWAIRSSYVDVAYITSADYNFDHNLNQSMLDGFNLESYEKDIEYLNNADKTLIGQTDASFPISNIPAGIFIAVARFFGADFEFKYNIGRFAYLLVYSFVCYFAIKKLKSGKMILAVICLFPTNLYLATNYSYDWCVTAFTILGTAYFVAALQEPDKPISVKDTIIMGMAFVVGVLPKLVYVVLMGMTLFMRKDWQSKKERKRYYLISIAIMVVVCVMFAIRSMVSIGGTGDTRGGDVNPSAQISGILSAPFDYVKVLFEFLAKYLSFGTMKEYISNFAYLGIGDYWIVFAVLLIAVALTDANNTVSFKIPLYMRALSVLLFVGMAALIATALYISFTPVAANTVLGCQPRYIIPLLAPLLLLVTGQRFNLIKNKTIYNGCVLGLLSVFTMIETYEQIIKVMI